MKKKVVLGFYYSWLDWKFSAKVTSALLNVTLCSIAVLAVVNYTSNANQMTEQTGTQLITLADQTITRAAEKVRQGANLLQTLAKTPAIVAAVKETNAARAEWTQEEISLKDQVWSDEDPNIEAAVQEIAGNPVSLYLRDFQNSNPEEVELFVTDGNGLNTAMTDRTSDFLQADEEWWKSTFANGYGSTYFGPVEYDESSRSYAMKIGVPIFDPSTNKAIGVLRGTLDISFLINILGNVRIGQTGNVLLLDAEGTVLYSHVPADIMKPAPDGLLQLFESGEGNWQQATDMDGKPSIVAYSFLGDDLGEALHWRVAITQQQTEVNRAVLRSTLVSVLASAIVAVFAIVLSTIIMSRSIAAPLAILTKKAQELSVGNIIRDENNGVMERLHFRRDEIGAIRRAFEQLTVYFQEAAAASTAIANKDLTITVTPNSEKDEMGVAFTKMLLGLRQTFGQVAENATDVSCAASQLAAASAQSGQASNQIAQTIQQVALGTVQQNEDVSKTSCSVEQLNRAIKKVANGAQEQAQALGKASTMAAQISSTVQQVTARAQSGVHGAAEAASAAITGGQTIQATIEGLQTIRNKVQLSAQKVREMGRRSEQIDAIAETIDEIASQTDLLALNAAIEVARVEGQSEKAVETILQHHMLGAANLLARLLESGSTLDSHDLTKLASQAQVQDFFISDPDGVIVASTNPGSLGFRFSEDRRQQSSIFRTLLDRRDGIVIQPIQAREQDNKPFLYVGISRRDRPGIVQVGMPAYAVYALVGYSRGFAVVADEIRKLSVHAKAATKEIAVLIRNIQKAVVEAVTVMEDAAGDVENRSAQAKQAGESLASILSTVQSVQQQMGEIASGIQHMGSSSKELVSAVEDANAVTKENTAATGEMATSSDRVRQAMENIASASEENSAAVEQVSASTEEVLAQVEQVSAAAAALTEMAQGLQKLVAQFALAADDRREAGS